MVSMIKKLQELLRLPDCKIDGCLIISPENRRYFTGFDSSDGYLLVTRNRAVFITDSRYIEAAKNTVKSCEVELQGKYISQIGDFFGSENASKIGIEASRMTFAVMAGFCEHLPSLEFVTDNTLDTFIQSLRSVKGFSEIESIKAAQRIAEKALLHAYSIIKEGVTEKDIQLELDFYMLRNGAEALSFDTIAVAGKKTSMPHGVPSDNVVHNGDFITMDFGAVVNGYHSDMTRTVALGFVTDEMKKVYETVLAAQVESICAYKAGVPCSEADKVARDIISNAGYGEYFGHGLGHGVGVEIHEYPSVSPRSDAVLREGFVVTDEPGIYIPEKFGVRIEDMIYITADGNINLTEADKSLTVL
jgi:Xaa-Pro aminopeptidase